MDYLSADTELRTARSEANGKPVANNTRLYRRGEDAIALVLHATDVVTFFSDGRTMLNSGGWRTVTTKDRINNFANVRVHTENGEWYIALPRTGERPPWPRRTIPKPYEAIDPGPEPEWSSWGCKAGEFRTDWVETRKFTRRIDMDPSDRWEEAGTEDYVYVLRWEEQTTYWGRESWSQRSNGRYERCPHCIRFDKVHRSWDQFMNGERYGRRAGRGYRQMLENLERFGDRKEWMRAFKAEGREVRAAQKRWHEDNERHRIPFFDGIELDADGRVLNAPDPKEVKSFQRAVDEQKREIAKFIKLARETLAEGMPMPSKGDCWYCMLHTTDDHTPWGDAVDHHEHLRSHLEEGYVVPSLLTNAMLEAGYQPAGVYILLDMNEETHRMGGHPKSDWSNSYDRGPYSTAMRALRKYLTKRLVPTNAKEVEHA